MVAAPSTSVSSRPRRLQHAVGEDMAALEIGGELDFVDGHKGDIEIARHRLDGGDPEARIRRLDLLLAGDQRDRVGADPLDAAVVDLARQKPQRQADDAGRMREHALDGEMGLAGIGRPEHGGDAGAAGARVADQLQVKRKSALKARTGALSSLPRVRGKARVGGGICITTIRPKVLCLRCGTSLERIAAESATRGAVRLRSLRHMARLHCRNTRSGVRRLGRSDFSAQKY